jgi:DNA ligase-1
MKKPADIIVELESNNSRLFKESVIIREMELNNEEFFDGIRYACDKLITFGVSEKTVPYNEKEESNVDLVPFSEFNKILEDLIKRSVTGNAAKDLLLEICNKTSNHTWNNWYRRILVKDLKCGVNEKTINNCSKKSKKKQFEIPTFSCQLAQDSRNYSEKMTGRKMLSEKLDGTRVLSILYPDGKVDQFSRNGKELPNFTEIKNQLSNIALKLKKPIVLDGEVMSSSFQALMTQLYRKEDVQTNDSVLYLFDLLTLEEFKAGYSDVPQTIRTTDLEDLFVDDLDNIKVLTNKYVDLDTEQGKLEFNIFNKQCIESGKEGVMIKDPMAPYECKRSSSWLKLKPVLTFDLEVVDLIEGDDKYVGKLGAIVCRGIEDGKEIEVNVGSGFTDEQRELFWSNKYGVIGKIAEVKCDVITQNQNGGYSLRFPVFMRLRGFEKGEKL